MKKHNTRTRLLSVLLAVMFAMTMLSALPTIAAPGDGRNANNSITMHAPEGESLNGMEVYAYQLLQEDVNSDRQNPGVRFYEPTDEFKAFFGTVEADFLADEDEDSDGFWLTYENGALKFNASAPTGKLSIHIKKSDADIIDENYFAASLLEKILGEPVDKPDDPTIQSGYSANAKTLSDWLRLYVKAKDSNGYFDNVKSYTKAKNSNTVTVSGLNDGYYFVISENAPAGVANVQAVLKMTEETDGVPDGKEYHMQLKAEYQDIEKKVNGKDSDTASAGEILEYEITFDIQDFSNYDDDADYTYELADTMQNQRLVTYDSTEGDVTYVDSTSTNAGAFQVTIDYVLGTVGDRVLQGRSYKYTDKIAFQDGFLELSNILKVNGLSYGTYTTGADGIKAQKFVLSFDVAALKALNLGKGAKITVKYKTELASDAALGNFNTAELEYSNDPYNPGSTGTSTYEDTTVVSSYGLIVDKKLSDNNTAKFSEVEFELYEATLNIGDIATPSLDKVDVTLGDIISFIDTDDDDTTLTPGDYYRADAAAFAKQEVKAEDDDDVVTTTLKLDANGQLKLYGLASGYYVLKESNVPDGYNSFGAILIHIAEDGTTSRMILDGSYAHYNEDGSQQGLDTSIKVEYLNIMDEPGLDAGMTFGAWAGMKEYLEFEVLNQKGFWLPSTGGMGVMLFGIGGILLIAAAAYLLFLNKKEKQDA